VQAGYDIIIIGGGPAGLTAGLYTSRARLKTLLIEQGLFGGYMTMADRIENYPGFPDGISGFELSELMHKQATGHGLETIQAEVTGMALRDGQKEVQTAEGNYNAKAVIIASGSERQKLAVPGEKEFTGKGVSYCATCDAAFFVDLPVAVVGGGNSAITEALHLSKFASKVVVIHRRDQLRATCAVREKAFAEPKIDFLWDTIVISFEGTDLINQIKLRNVKSGQESTLDIAGTFISNGFKPNTEYLKGIVSLDSAGAIITNDNLETNVPGIFAAGDIRTNSIRQIVAAAGDGAIAAVNAEKYISE